MIFFEEGDSPGNTNYNATVPLNLLYLLPKGFSHQYVAGCWGSYLSLWIDTEDFTFWIHYFWRLNAGKMLAQVNNTIYTLHHLLVGRVSGELNGSNRVELSTELSQFFVIPGGTRQQVFMNKGEFVSVHIDYRRSYLEKNRHHYKALQPILERYDRKPERAFHERSVSHNYLLEHLWRKVLREIYTVSNPVLYLEGQARELLRMHYEQLEAKTSIKEYEAGPDKINFVRAKAAYKVKKLLERDIAVRHLMPSLARKAGLNEFDLKRAFKEVYKTTIHQYLLRLRMQAAKEELLTTQKRIGEIAMECGFNNAAYFSRHFKKVFGESPSGLRRKGDGGGKISLI